MPAMYQPTLVIGLGGTGKNIILALKKMIAENSRHGMNDYPFLRLLCVDTDVDIPRSNSSIQTIDESELAIDRQKEYFPLRADFNVVPDLANFPSVQEWFPPSYKHFLTPAELEKGAGQKKPIGRFTLAWNAQDLYNRLNLLLANPVDMQVANDKAIGDNISNFTNVFICGSVCGGTGAGTFLDVAYLVRHIQSTLSRQIYVYGIIALSSLFEGIQGDSSIRPNCYASMVELDHFMNERTFTNDYRLFRPGYKNFSPDFSKSAANAPFDFPFLFDKTNRDGFSFPSPSSFGEMAARFIYLLTGHEVSKDWQSMDNNVRKNLENNYKKEMLWKSISYRSMGEFSVVFPKRMVIQLCGYKLAGEYFSTMLDEKDAPQEIENMAKFFLNAIKLNPANDQIEDRFDNYRDSDTAVKFTEYLESQKNAFIDGERDKKDLIRDLSMWKEDMDKKVVEFRLMNVTVARQVREEFLAQLGHAMKSWLDLKLYQDHANKDMNGQPRMLRGAITRTDKLIAYLIQAFQDAAERYRKKEDEMNATAQNAKADIESAISDLESAVKSLIPNGNKIRTLTEDVLSRQVEHLNAVRMGYIANWIRQLMTGILENNIPKYPGLVNELEAIKKTTNKGVLDFSSLRDKIREYLEKNRRYEPNSLTDVIFDFTKDVDGVYSALIEQKKEEYIFESLSDTLSSRYFGSAYEKIKDLAAQSILTSVLKVSEQYFIDIVEAISIEDKILSSPDHLTRLVNGNYYKSSSVFLGLDGGELSRVGLNLDSGTFFAITFPDNYTGKPCASLKGALSTLSGRKICPVDADPEKFLTEPCPKYNKCLKQLILKNAPQNIALIPTSELSEINIINTVAGYPLHAVTTLLHGCRSRYMETKQKLESEVKAAGLQEERLHMLGPIQMTDILDPTEDPRNKLVEFRKKLLAGLCGRRLKIEALKVSFITKMDIQLNRKDKPSLVLGANLDEAMRKFQSTAVADSRVIDQFDKEIGEFLVQVSGSDEHKKRYGEMMTETFNELSKNLLPGMTTTDLQLMDEFAREKGWPPLIVDKPVSDIFG